jgi:hypothetical protein
VIDVIGELFKKYYNLLTASSYVLPVPVRVGGGRLERRCCVDV